MTNNTREHLSAPIEARFDRLDNRARREHRVRREIRTGQRKSRGKAVAS